MTNYEPFHEGERRVQQRAGQTREAERNSPMVSSRIPVGAISFLQGQSFLALTVCDEGEIWCLPMVGRPGWMSVAGPETLKLDLGKALGPVDPRILRAADELRQVGGVVLDFATRRRLRLNGHLSKSPDDVLVLSVAEVYPNCPKYITRRTITWLEPLERFPRLQGRVLTEEQQSAFRNTDVFFIGTQHPFRGLDASHRGGPPGFVECPSPHTLRFADFPGNSLFNTLGNLELDNHVGLLLPDFRGIRMLEVTGTARVIYGTDSRYVEVHIQRWMEMPLCIVESDAELSPFNP